MTAPTVPDGRYGPPATAASRRRALLGVVALAVLGLTVLAWVAMRTVNPAVSWRDVGFELDGDRAVTVVFDVIRADPSVPVVCRLEALNVHYAQVGVLMVDVAPGDRGAQRERAVVATNEEATTGIVQSCWVAQE